jgi:hypothetical protein
MHLLSCWKPWKISHGNLLRTDSFPIILIQTACHVTKFQPFPTPWTLLTEYSGEKYLKISSDKASPRPLHCGLEGKYTSIKAIGERLQGPCYLSRNDHDRKIRSTKQRTDTGKYSFVNRTIKLWNSLPAEALVTFPCKPHIFRKRVRKLSISEAK